MEEVIDKFGTSDHLQQDSKWIPSSNVKFDKSLHGLSQLRSVALGLSIDHPGWYELVLITHLT